jgi:plasmid maintenance system antidote protein VapI
MAAEFKPLWVSPPGDSISAALAARSLTIEDLARETELGEDAAQALLRGRYPLGNQLAERLADLIGGSVGFWLRREEMYRRRLPRQTYDSETVSESEFFDRLPIRDMKAFGWLAPFNSATTRAAILQFFQSSDGGWQENGLSLSKAVAFRTSDGYETNPISVAAWLRQGAIVAERSPCGPLNKDGLSAAIPELRALSRIKEPKIFFPKLMNIGRQNGVVIVFVRTPSGCRASGATYLRTDGAGIVQLSFRYRTDDHFWFTLFHELGHLLLHTGSPLFLEGPEYIPDIEEQEANEYAAQTLVPSEFGSELASLESGFKPIMKLARKIGVSPGILVGQMQHRGLLRYGQMNFLKVRYDWKSVDEATP